MTSTKSEAAKRLGLRAHLLSYVLVNAVQIVLWWLLTPDVFFWPLYSLAAWGIGLAFHGWAVYSPSKVDRRHAQRELAQRRSASG